MAYNRHSQFRISKSRKLLRASIEWIANRGRSFFLYAMVIYATLACLIMAAVFVAVFGSEFMPKLP